MTDVMRLPTGRLRVSRIVYFSDLQHSDTREIPVGVIAEATLTTLRAIGAALRPAFMAEEAALMGPIMRDLLKDPMEALWPEILEALKNAEPGRAIEQLSAKHTGSLSVLAPMTIEVPRQWLLERDEQKLRTLVSDRISVTLTDEYFKLLFPPRGGNDGVDDPTVKTKLAA